MNEHRPEFTYRDYREMLELLKSQGYRCVSYDDERDFSGKVVILRHDVDFDPSKCVAIAEIEANLGFASTYFFLVTSPFYNIFSYEVNEVVRCLLAMGHKVGLHFDESIYPESVDIVERILHEINVLEMATQCRVSSVSMHRPSQKCLEGDWKIPGACNTYAKDISERFLYASDSRGCWRKPILDIIAEKADSAYCNRLHILTHPFWYNEVEESGSEVIMDFCERLSMKMLWNVSENISDPETMIDQLPLLRARLAQVRRRKIDSARLTLRPIAPQDVYDMYEYGSDEESCRYLRWGPYKSVEEAKIWIEGKIKDCNPDELLYGVVERESEKLIGAVRAYRLGFQGRTADISYILNQKFGGKGYAAEAVRALTDLLFEIVGVEQVFADVDEENSGSLKLLQRLGFERVTEEDFDVIIKGQSRNYCRFVLERKK